MARGQLDQPVPQINRALMHGHGSDGTEHAPVPRRQTGRQGRHARDEVGDEIRIIFQHQRARDALVQNPAVDAQMAFKTAPRPKAGKSAWIRGGDGGKQRHGGMIKRQADAA